MWLALRLAANSLSGQEDNTIRISNIADYLGGANNVNALEIIRGEALPFVGVIRDSDGDLIDIEDYTITAVAEFYNTDITTVGRGRSASITIADIQSSSKADRTLTVTKDSDTSTGRFTVIIPADLADDSDTAGIDEQNAVLMAAVYITYDNGQTPVTIRRSRLILIIRHGG